MSAFGFAMRTRHASLMCDGDLSLWPIPYVQSVCTYILVCSVCVLAVDNSRTKNARRSILENRRIRDL